MNLSEPRIGLRHQQLLQNGKYCLTKVVGQGGFGITYQGLWNTEVKGSLGTMKTEVPICIKEYFFKDYCFRDVDGKTVRVHSDTGKKLFDKFKEKLIKEAKILSEVQHPHIVNVLEVFEENNTTYIAMEYIEGCSLKYMMDKKGVLPEEKVLKYVHQIGEALAFVHKKQILHLDIKPSNILIDKQDNARLIDFGVSKRYDTEKQETSTIILTLSKGFASIEQYDDEGIQKFTPCPDIYSLGATMYNLLTGKIPTESILRATRPLADPKVLNENLTEKTQGVILKAMAIVSAERFQSVRSMLKALDKPLKKADEENELREETPFANNDDTLIKTVAPILANGGDEETIVKGEEVHSGTIIKNPPTRKRSKSKIVLLVACLLGIVTSVFLFFMQDKPAGNPSAPLLSIEKKDTIPSENHTAILPNSIPKETQKKESDTASQTGKEQQQTASIPEVEHPSKEKNKVAVVASQQTEPDILEEKTETAPKNTEPKVNLQMVYDSLLTTGKAKMDANEIDEAEKDFSKAKELFLTEEVVRLQISLEEKREALRIAKYEIKMNLGTLQIVRKKSTQKYGAIDTKGIEIIPCKYLSVGKSDTGRAFEREDNLFDIYNEEGVLITTGQAYY